MNKRFVLLVVLFLLPIVPNDIVFAATCAELAPGATCQSSCVTDRVISGSSDCGWLKTCCKPASPTDGICTGTGANAGKTGRCGTYCGSDTVDAVRCTGAANGAASNGLYCCIAKNDTTAPAAAPAATAPVVPAAGSIGTVSFSNPLAFDTVQGATETFINAFQGIIVWLALIFLVLGGILYITSAGNSKSVEKAKGMITAAMIGLAIGIAAPSFLKEIGNVLGWGGAQVPASVSAAKSATEVAQGILNFLLSITGLLAMLMMVIGGLMFFAAAGDEKRAETAKNIVKYSIMGVALAVTSLIIIRTIAGLFTGSSGSGSYY